MLKKKGRTFIWFAAAVACLLGAGLAYAGWSCSGQDCPYDATCSGDYFTLDGCAIQCYVTSSAVPGMLIPAGSANCAGGSSGGKKTKQQTP